MKDIYTCYVDGVDQPHEQRDGVRRQLRLQSHQEGVEVELGGVLHDGSHPRLALDPGHVHAVHHAVHLLQHRADDGLHLHGGHVLPPPPVRVSHPVHEVHPAELIGVQEVTRSEESAL